MSELRTTPSEPPSESLASDRAADLRGLQNIGSRLHSRGGDRLSVLTSGPRTAPVLRNDFDRASGSVESHHPTRLFELGLFASGIMGLAFFITGLL